MLQLPGPPLVLMIFGIRPGGSIKPKTTMLDTLALA
jgi:hypothetical protein